MKEDVNSRIIKKIVEGPYDENTKSFLLWAIREEVARQGARWSYKEEYDTQLRRLCRKDSK